MVTNGLQRNVHSAGFVVYLVETTDMQQLCTFTLAGCSSSALQPRRLASTMRKSRRQRGSESLCLDALHLLNISGPVRN